MPTLTYHLNEKLYSKQGTIQQTNFARTITDADFKQRALQSFKDEYMLDFINIEDTELVDEREIEQTIVLNVKNFIMAFGQDFSFIGNQYRLEVSDTSKPMGVATYRTSKDLPERLRNALPDIEELKKLMN
jgi:predicted nuclease of restriction endonuclease-like (RecB) superfamily